MPGINALAKACKMGALPELKRFLLVHNPAVPKPLIEAIAARQAGKKP